MKHKRSRHHADHRNPWGAAQSLAVKTAADLTNVDCLAPHIFILDVEGGGPPIYRLAGREIQSLVGSNPRGKEFYGYWDSEARAALKPYFDLSAEHHRAFRLFSIVPMTKTEIVELETILIPVSAADARKKSFIGISLALKDRPGNTKPRGRIQHLQHIAFVHDASIGDGNGR